MNFIKKFFRKMKNRSLAMDELSFFLICIALIVSIILALLRLHLFVLLAWLPLFIAYWRSYSKNRLQRFKENQIFIKYFSFSFVSSCFKTLSRRLMRKETHIHFKCKSCTQQLRIPKKTDHIKVTCPKCNYSFVKKTIRGYMNKQSKTIS